MTRRSRTTTRIRAVVALATEAALWPSSAEAHLVTTGLGPIYDGISHVLMSPDDLLPIVMMGFLAGLNGPAARADARCSR